MLNVSKRTNNPEDLKTVSPYAPRNIVSTTDRITGEKIAELTTDGILNKVLLRINWPTVKIVEKDTEGNKLMCLC